MEKELGRPPTKNDIEADESVPGYKAFIADFGTLVVARWLAGIVGKTGRWVRRK
jgi:hypothetical protein